MPLVIPGVTTKGGNGDKNDEWTNKLVGKSLSDDQPHSETVFSKRDLPETTRIISPGQMVTKDLREDRLNVYLSKEGIVSHVNHG